MKKWTPSIMIWSVALYDQEYDGMLFQNLYFLSRRRAHKWVEKHLHELTERNLAWGIGGEQLWLW